MRHTRSCGFMVILIPMFSGPVWSQDSVDVTFRAYFQAQPYLVGEFNGWGPTQWPMTPIGNNTFVRTARLRIGGHIGGGVSGAYQYKFYPPLPGQQEWPNDPLNHRINPADNNNSVLHVNDPTIYHFLPNQLMGVVRTEVPEISAYLFPKVGSTVDSASIVLRTSSETYTGLGKFYNDTTKQFRFRLPNALPNGANKIWLQVGSNIDSVTITVQAGFVQITNLGNFVTRNPLRTLYGTVEDTTIKNVKIIRNDQDTVEAVVAAGKYSLPVMLKEGTNTFRATVIDSTGMLRQSQPVTFTYAVSHTPTARITFAEAGNEIIMSGLTSTDPDSGQAEQLTFYWSADSRNPQSVDLSVAGYQPLRIPKPVVAGEYYFGMIAVDPDGNKDTTRNFFTILKDGSFQNTSLASVPDWVKRGRVYELFFKSLTPEGTINTAVACLPYFKSLGVNILWVMPVMENASPINNGPGPGYNIKNFYRVAPEYGTNEDFKNFVHEAHKLGLKVILDVTPNHTSFLHPFAVEAKQYRQDSPYWDFYQHTYIDHNTNNLGLCEDNGFYYYCGFSNQLLNYNWNDIDARYYMAEVYKWWIREFDLDGYRYDVYWGPRRRYGEQIVGAWLRQELKRIKPDIYLLAEDDGTGPGTEVIYADRNGGADSGYDWLLYSDAIRPLYSQPVDNLSDRVTNFGGNMMGFIPGPNSSFFRFLENHDEERIAYHYGSYEKTMPAATVIFTVPGMPMIYSGQEVGFGYGMLGDDPVSKDKRRRGVITWNTAGRPLLTPHYQKLAYIRAQFPAFSTQQMIRFTALPTGVYAYSRPYDGEDGIAAVNVTFDTQEVSLTLSSSILATSIQNGKTYYANDVYNDTTYVLTSSGGTAKLALRLRPFGSSVFVVSDSIKRLNLPALVSVEKKEAVAGRPSTFLLHQNFPNPFNPSTTIRYEVPSRAYVVLKIHNMLGEEVNVLTEGVQEPGSYTVSWNGLNKMGTAVSSGLYFVQIIAGKYAETKKMLLLR